MRIVDDVVRLRGVYKAEGLTVDRWYRGYFQKREINCEG